MATLGEGEYWAAVGSLWSPEGDARTRAITSSSVLGLLLFQWHHGACLLEGSLANLVQTQFIKRIDRLLKIISEFSLHLSTTYFQLLGIARNTLVVGASLSTGVHAICLLNVLFLDVVR